MRAHDDKDEDRSAGNRLDLERLRRRIHGLGARCAHATTVRELRNDARKINVPVER